MNDGTIGPREIAQLALILSPALAFAAWGWVGILGAVGRLPDERRRGRLLQALAARYVAGAGSDRTAFRPAAPIGLVALANAIACLVALAGPAGALGPLVAVAFWIVEAGFVVWLGTRALGSAGGEGSDDGSE